MVQSKNLKASLMSSTRALFSDKARCFSQSERALCGNLGEIDKIKLRPLLYRRGVTEKV